MGEVARNFDDVLSTSAASAVLLWPQATLQKSISNA
jgi:hypothetical protein